MSSRYSLNKNKYLSPDESERLEYLLKSFIDKERRNCCLLLLALYTGARATELLNLSFEDLNDEYQSVFIKGIKGSNDREIPLPGWLYKEVSRIQSPSRSMFPISYNRLRQIWHFYRPTQKKFHSLRHTFAIRLYKKSKDIRLLQVALGHRNITNTMIYADYLYTQEELRKLIL